MMVILAWETTLQDQKNSKDCNKGKMDNVQSDVFIRKYVTVVMENETEILGKYTSLRNQLARGGIFKTQ